MNPPKKPFSRGDLLTRESTQPGRLRQSRSVIAQPKMDVTLAQVKRPIAPPPYHPQTTPRVLQTKMAVSSQPSSGQLHDQPIAPPAYRPQNAPRCLQPKSATQGQTPTAQALQRGVTPSVYCPQAVPRCLQAKVANGNQNVPAFQPPRIPIAPPVYRPQAAKKALQARSGITKSGINPPNLAANNSISKIPNSLRGNAQTAERKSFGSPVIQPYTEVTKSGHKGKLSQNDLYFVTGAGLYVKKNVGAPAPRYCHATVDKIGDYIKHEGDHSFLKDCLHTAEEIMASATIDYEGPGVVRSKSTLALAITDIGESDAQNIAIAKDAQTRHAAAVNEYAAPNAGEAFMIVETGKIRDYPYHAAGVVAVDGTDRVTLEMFAGSADAKDSERKYNGKFGMYGGAGQSFHEEYSGAFTTPITIAIKKK
jgi:hypothetical protein